MGEAEIVDGCVRNARQEKQASGIVVYLMEELGDARLRTAQLKKYVQEVIELVEKSKHRDEFFEVAGHLIHGIPDTVFKLDKALDAAALAAARLDYEEIKQNLKPEKADELENVLQDVRLQYLKRRSSEGSMDKKSSRRIVEDLRVAYLGGVEYGEKAHEDQSEVEKYVQHSIVSLKKLAAAAGKSSTPNVPLDLIRGVADDIYDLTFHVGVATASPISKKSTEIFSQKDTFMRNAKEAADELESMAQATDATDQIPLARLAKLIGILEGSQSRTASDLPKKAATFFRNMAATLRKETNPSRVRLAGVLRRVFADGMQMDAGTMLAAIFSQASSREDVMKGFMQANPNMSKEDAEKAADMWERHRNVVKDKHK